MSYLLFSVIRVALGCLFWVFSSIFAIHWIKPPLPHSYHLLRLFTRLWAMVLYNLRDWSGDLPFRYSVNHPVYRTYWFITISVKWLSKIDVKSLELAPNDQFHIHFKHRKGTCLLIVLFMSTYKNMYSLLAYSFHGRRLLSQSTHEAVSRPVETIWWCQSRGRVTLMQIPWLLTNLILNDFYSWDLLSSLFLMTVSPFESHIIYNITGSWIQIACVLLILGRLMLVF